MECVFVLGGFIIKFKHLLPKKTMKMSIGTHNNSLLVSFPDPILCIRNSLGTRLVPSLLQPSQYCQLYLWNSNSTWRSCCGPFESVLSLSEPSLCSVERDGHNLLRFTEICMSYSFVPRPCPSFRHLQYGCAQGQPGIKATRVIQALDHIELSTQYLSMEIATPQ